MLVRSGVGATSRGRGIIDLFLTGLDDEVYYQRFQNGVWDRKSLGSPGGNKIKGSPSAASPGASEVDVFVVSANDGNVYRNHWENRVDSDYHGL